MQRNDQERCRGESAQMLVSDSGRVMHYPWLSSIPEPACVVGLDGRFIAMNAAGADFLQATAGSLGERRLGDFFPQAGQMLAQTAEDFRAGGEFTAVTERMPGPDLDRWIEFRLSRLEEAGGMPQACLGLWQEVSEVKRAHGAYREAIARARKFKQERVRAVQENQHFLERATEVLPDLLHIFDLDVQRPVFMNRDLAAVLGYTGDALDEARPQLPFGLVHPEDVTRLVAHLERCRDLREGQVAELEYRLRQADGHWRWFRNRDAAFSMEGGRVRELIGITSDITAQRQIETERADLESRLRQAQKMEAIGTLAGGIAHDFNNILGIIFGYTELALSDLPEDHPAGKSLAEVVNAANRAKDLVRQILLFSRQGSEDRQPVQIQLVVNEALKMLRAALPSTIDIQTDLRAAGATVLSHPSQVHQIMMNLCSNAVHAINGHPGVLAVALVPETLDTAAIRSFPELKPGTYLRLSVQDTGHGIPPETLGRIFEPFFTTKPLGQGTGLGLAVVHGIVKQCRGAIRVNSTVGQGTRFDIYLPVAPGEAMPPKEKTRASRRAGLGQHILLVDDETSLTAATSQVLQHLGYRVTCQNSSQQAWQLFQQNPRAFDLVITDQTMPHMTGTTLAAQMLALRPELPVILTTGYKGQVDSEEEHRLGIREILDKPATLTALSQAVDRALTQTGPEALCKETLTNQHSNNLLSGLKVSHQ